MSEDERKFLTENVLMKLEMDVDVDVDVDDDVDYIYPERSKKDAFKAFLLETD